MPAAVEKVHRGKGILSGSNHVPLQLTLEVKNAIAREALNKLVEKRELASKHAEQIESSLHSGSVKRRDHSRDGHVVVRDHHQRRLGEIKKYVDAQS